MHLRHQTQHVVTSIMTKRRPGSEDRPIPLIDKVIVPEVPKASPEAGFECVSFLQHGVWVNMGYLGLAFICQDTGIIVTLFTL